MLTSGSMITGERSITGVEVTSDCQHWTQSLRNPDVVWTEMTSWPIVLCGLSTDHYSTFSRLQYNFTKLSLVEMKRQITCAMIYRSQKSNANSKVLILTFWVPFEMRLQHAQYPLFILTKLCLYLVECSLDRAKKICSTLSRCPIDR